MPIATRVTLAEASRPVGGLLASARPIGGEWWRGVEFSKGQCLVPQVAGVCLNGAGAEKVTSRPSGPLKYDPFFVVSAVECTSASRSDLAAYAEASLEVVREFAIASEFMSGAASGNDYLAGSTSLGSMVSPVAALACIEQHAAQALAGRLVFLHASPEIGTHLLAEQAIWRDGRLWRTALGNIVVVSSGYDGRSPADPSVAISGGDEAFLYATGEVYAEVGMRETKSSVDRTVNTDQTWSEELAVVAYDDCYRTAVGTSILHCETAGS